MIKSKEMAKGKLRIGPYNVSVGETTTTIGPISLMSDDVLELAALVRASRQKHRARALRKVDRVRLTRETMEYSGRGRGFEYGNTAARAFLMENKGTSALICLHESKLVLGHIHGDYPHGDNYGHCKGNRRPSLPRLPDDGKVSRAPPRPGPHSLASGRPAHRAPSSSRTRRSASAVAGCSSPRISALASRT